MTGMQYRTLGRSGLRVSAVGFGTAQLRRVSETQAIDTLLRGFELGVNIVHTAPDYEGAEDLVAAAVARSGRDVIVASSAYDVHHNRGRVKLFEKLFDATRRKLDADTLDLFGIASVEDRENLGENVWGPRGMVEFLQRMKAGGRLLATFCTTHGRPEFARKLIESGAFDAVMLAYNDLGFHALTVHPPPNWHFEDIRRTKSELFPLCARLGVGLMVMLPFGGGLVVPSKAFPPAAELDRPGPPVSGAQVLRSILANDEVSCVLPGTACVEEAEENALAGHAPCEPDRGARLALAERLDALRTSLCSRCGACEPLCSQHLPVSWLFRAGAMSTVGTSPYETWEDVEYFRLHPRRTSACATCSDVTCACPVGIDIPAALKGLHGTMTGQLRRGVVPPPPADRPPPAGNRLLGARVVRRELPESMWPGHAYTCRLNVENTGLLRWRPGASRRGGTRLEARLDRRLVASARVRHVVHPGGRCHFAFELTAPTDREWSHLELRLVPFGRVPRLGAVTLFSDDIPIRTDT